METGKVKTPDQESTPAFVCPECGGNHSSAEHGNVKAQHARLKDAVVEAAKRRRKAKLAKPGEAGDYVTELHAAMVAEHSAVDALIAFEEEHQIGE